MAPSPELGQPKAPDKVGESRSSQTVIDGMTTTTTTADYGAHPHNQRDQPKTSSTSLPVATQQDAENLEQWDEGELRKLLDEAITYKRPKDREHKSETFKELLQHVELEDQTRDCFSNRVFSRPARGSNRHTHSSLQDLVETVHNEHNMLDGDFIIGGQNRRHHHNSRQKKYTSVSSRQREGGSLPSNVNVSFCNLCPYDEPLLNEFNRRKNKNDKAIVLSGAGSTALPDGVIRGGVVGVVGSGGGAYDAQVTADGKINHTVIEIGDTEADETRHLLAHDSLAQGIPDPLSGDEGTELNPMKKLPRVSYTSHQILNVDVSVGEASRSAHSIDKTIQFNTMLKSTSKPLDVNTVQLSNSYVAVNSCTDGKSGPAITLSGNQNGKYPTYPHGIQKHIDENGNSLQAIADRFPTSSQANKLKTKPKINKADRNTKTLIAKEIKGNRGNDNIESLLAFIENKETTKRNGVINVNKNILNADKSKKKNAAKKDTNGGNNKLKKSNSLEELKSSSKLEEEIAQSECVQENIVTMRQKQQTKKSAELKENTNNSGNKQSKRGERRSWGTEELSYLGETNSIAKEDDLNKIDKENRRKEHNLKQNNNNNNNNNKKRDEHSLSIVSIESISTSSETAEFHVVTKKKKAKKRQILEEARQKQQHMHPYRNSGDQSSHSHRGKYHPSHNYTNDRDVYLTSFNANENRRKSTSSVPPSEKSDSSDLDSVHSLPVESSTRHTNLQATSTSSGSTPQASYADIARITNPEKALSTTLPMDKWPIVSNKNSDSPESSSGGSNGSGSVGSVITALNNKNQQSGIRSGIKFYSETIEVPNTVQVHDTMSSCSSTSSNSTIVKQVTYSQSLIDEKSTAAPIMSNSDDTKRTIGLTVHSSKLIESSPRSTLVDISKNPLQKSKSVDNDSYVNMTNEHYPALQKTVKPQKQYQSLPAVELLKSGKSNAKTPSNCLANASCASTFTTTTNTTGTLTPTASSSATTTIITTMKKKNVNSFSSSSSHPMQKDGIATKTNQIESLAGPEMTNVNVDKTSISDQNIILVSYTNSFSKNDGFTEAITKATQSSNVTGIKKSTRKEKSTHHSNNNRPAVIILNDNSNHMDSVSPLLFGDFNEEDLRLLEPESDRQFNSNHQFNSITNDSSSCSSQILDDSTDIGAISSSSISTATNQIPIETFTSPQSDLGYSSSHNRSAMSTESLDAVAAAAAAAAAAAQSSSTISSSTSSSTVSSTLSNHSISHQHSVTTASMSATANVATSTTASTYFVPIDNIGHVASNQTISIANVTTASCGGGAGSVEQQKHQPQHQQPPQQQQQPQQQTICSEPNNNTILNNNSNSNSSCSNSSNSTNCNHTDEIFNQTAVTAPNWDKILATSEKELNVRYVAPAVAPNINSYNHDKIVNFVGMAWENIMCGVNGGAQFYNGQ